MGEGGGEVNRCRTEGSYYQVTIIYLKSLYPNIERREVTKLLDTNKNTKAFVFTNMHLCKQI